MNNSRNIICLVALSLFLQGLVAATIPIKRNAELENFACPKTEYQYWVDTKDIYGKYEWKITGGYFKKWGQNVTEISETNWANVIVVWNNVKSTNGNVPKGTITLTVYNKNYINQIVDNGSTDQKIKSLNDILPQTPQSAETAINYGIQTIRVTGQSINYPGLTYPNGMPIPVNKYERKVPAGWSVNGGTKTASGTYTSIYSIVDITTDYGSVGGVEVRGVNDCYGSDDYTVYSFPVNFTRKGLGVLEYPKTIIAGQANTYSVTVTPIAGATYEWQAPAGWSINNGGNTYTGTENIISVRNGVCMTAEKIKVRYKGSSQLYSEWAEVPSTMIAPVINIPSELKQYHSAIFSLNLPDENVSSVTWKINGVNAANVVNTSTAQLTINQKGTVSVSAVLSLKSCTEMITIPAMNVNVEETVFSISGPSTLYSQATYTIDNLPPGAAVEWSVTQPYIAPTIYVQNSGTVILTNHYGIDGIGTHGTLQAVVTVGNQQITLTKDILFGWAVASIGKSRLDMRPGEYILEAYTTNDPNTSITSTWSVTGASAALVNFPYPDDASYTDKAGRLKVLEVYTPGFYTVCATANDGNYTTQPYCADFYIDDYKPTGMFSLSPNPATTSVTIEMDEAKLLNTTTQKTGTNPKSVFWQIQLWNSFGLIKTRQTDQTQYQLDLTGVPPGFYYLHVIKDGQTYRRQLIVK